MTRTLSDDVLVAALDAGRATVVGKVAGLDFEGATRHRLPSGVTLIGIVKHLAWVEKGWFDESVAGNPFVAGDIDASFQLDASETVESVVAAYEAECGRSRAIVAVRSFDDVIVIPHWFFGFTDLRWVHLHMIRETARHLGHMDILRELTDGVTGY